MIATLPSAPHGPYSRVLIVDDEESLRKVLRLGLEAEGYDVREAGSASEGLRALEKYLDGMPEIRLIQDSLIERARRCDVPVIVNSSLDQAMGEVLDLVLSTADRLVRA